MTAILAFLRAGWGIAKLIPWQVYVVIGLFASAYAYGVSQHHRGYLEAKTEDSKIAAAEREKYDKEVATLKAIQQTVITRTVIEYRDRIVVQKEKANEIQKDIQENIEAHVLDSPVVAGWVRRDLDAAALGSLPDDPAGTTRPADPVEIATVVQTEADNLIACRADQARLSTLQSLVSTLGEKSHE